MHLLFAHPNLANFLAVETKAHGPSIAEKDRGLFLSVHHSPCRILLRKNISES
jgi:hypothetical protein